MIKVFVPSDELCGYVWDMDDWLKLRVDYRIIGSLIGSSTSKQETCSSLPAVLLPEEVTLLKEKRFARLVCCPSANDSNDESSKNFEEKERKLMKALKERYLERRRKEIEDKIDIIIQGKRKKNPSIGEMDKEKIIDEELEKSKILCERNKHLLISKDDTLINESELIDAEWPYPTCEKEKLRYDAFKDLWEKNYRLSCGVKFGGDFLCYEGDPLEYHATYIIMCKTNNEQIGCKELVSHGRVGTCTRKIVVIATKNYEKNETDVTYLSLQWIENRRLEK